MHSFQRDISILATVFKTWRSWKTSDFSGDLAQSVTKALGGFKGPLLKAGQLTAMVPDLLPKEFSSVLETLCQDAPPMGWPFVRRRMNSELGPNWNGFFQWFSPQASFSASLGQVHKARLRNGTLVACKLQYPDMDRVVDTDLRHIALISWLYQQAIHNSVDVQALRHELRSRLEEELDYVHEAQNMAWFQEIFHTHPEIHIPVYEPSLSTRRLLTMSWCEGVSLKSILETDPSERQVCPHHLGILLLRAWYTPFYKYGILHGDPHHGNFSYGSGKLNIMDFGCVRRFSPSFVKSVCTLYAGTLANNPYLLRQAYEEWGFKDLSPVIMEALGLWTQFIFKPFLTDRAERFDELASTETGKSIVIHIHSLLRQEGRLSLPPEFLIMDRVAVVLGSLLIRLRAKANWYQEMNELMTLFSLDMCENNQQQLLTLHTPQLSMPLQCS